jgi:L-amino acid N-acyltransferase YncA
MSLDTGMESNPHDEIAIRAAAPSDAAAIAESYNHYVAETAVTFEEAPTSVTEMARRLPWLLHEKFGLLQAGINYYLSIPSVNA